MTTSCPKSLGVSEWSRNEASGFSAQSFPSVLLLRPRVCTPGCGVSLEKNQMVLPSLHPPVLPLWRNPLWPLVANASSNGREPRDKGYSLLQRYQGQGRWRRLWNYRARAGGLSWKASFSAGWVDKRQQHSGYQCTQVESQATHKGGYKVKLM